MINNSWIHKEEFVMTTEPEITPTPPPSEVSSQCKESELELELPEDDDGWDTDLEEDSKSLWYYNMRC
jgi:hypothetical protein